MRFRFITEGFKNICYKRPLEKKYTFAEQMNEKLPETYDQAADILEPFLMPVHKYYVCVNDCIIHRKENANRVECQVSGESRYEEDGKTAKRNFTYFPLTPRIRRMVQRECIWNLLTAHQTKNTEPFIQKDIQDSKIWKEDWFGPDGVFKDVDLGLSLSACLDSVNPFAHLHKHSMWLIKIFLNNLPPPLRKSSAGILNIGIIPSASGGRKPNIDPYLALLAEELKSLEECKMQDYEGKNVTVFAKLLNFELDFPAIGKVLHFPGSARSYRACPFCKVVGVNCSCNKTLFLDNRRYLPTDHPMRLKTDAHFGLKLPF